MATFTGGTGADTANATTGTITGITVTGGSGNNVADLIDTVGDFFVGNDGGDTIVAGGGADAIFGGPGADSLDGGGGDDVFRYVSTPDIVAGEAVVGGLGSDTIAPSTFPGQLTSFDFSSVSISSIEVLRVRDPDPNNATFLASQVGGGQLATNLELRGIGAGLSGGILNFNMGTSTTLDISGFTFTNGALPSIVINGDGDAETIVGSTVGDTINAGEGADRITGGLGADTLNGGGGDDTFVFRIGFSDVVAEEAIAGGTGTDTLEVNAQTNFSSATLTSLERLTLGSGVASASFTASQFGAAGISNTLVVNKGVGSSVFVATSQNGAAFSASGWTITNQIGFTSGVVISDVDAGASTLTGSSLDDFLIAGTGADSLSGGNGDDYFRFNAASDVQLGDSIDGGLGSNDELNILSDNLTGTSTLSLDFSLAGIQSIERLSLLTQPAATSAQTLTFNAAQVGTGLASNLWVQNGSGVTAHLLFTAAPAGATSLNLSGFTFPTLGGAQGTPVATWNADDSITINGGALGDTLVGSRQRDTIIGNGGADTISGQGGADTINGGLGSDVMAGDEGDDTFVYTGANDIANTGEQVFGGNGTDTIRINPNPALTFGPAIDFTVHDTFVNSIERLDLGSGGRAATARFSANQVGTGLSPYLHVIGCAEPQFSPSNLVFYMEDATSLNLAGFTFAGGITDVNTHGDDSAETVYGSNIGDFIFANGGADTLWGSYGADGAVDQLFGGDGSDTYFVYEATDTAAEGSGAASGTDLVYSYSNHTLGANVEHLTLFGGNAALNTATGNALDNALNAMQYYGGSGINFSAGDGTDTVYGSYYADTISGGNGNDTLWGSWGADGNTDAMTGGNGADTYFVQEGLDTVSETNTSTAASELDTVYSAIDMTLGSNLENLFIYGNATAATGNSAANAIIGSYSGLQLTLSGLGGADYIVGGGGNDTIDGGLGIDTLFGSSGADTFAFTAGQANGDILNDFDGAGAGALDTLRFSGYGPGATFTQVDSTHWQVNYLANTLHEVITFNNGAAINAQDVVFV